MSTPTPDATLANGTLPWWLRVLTSPTLLANVVGFGAALVLLYTAAVEWPRQANSFGLQMKALELRIQEVENLVRENSRLIQHSEAQDAEHRRLAQELRDELRRLRKLEDDPR